MTKEKDPDRFRSLQHLYNVVVFPTKGKRPLANMLSTGDLDGDVYMVIWDQTLVNGLKDENILEPASSEINPNIKLQNTNSNDFFGNIAFYLRNDYLGQLSSIHVAICDQIERQEGDIHDRMGARHPDA